jgi:hypothetical protein
MAALLGRALLEQQQAVITVACAVCDLFVGAQLTHPRQNSVRLIFERIDRLGKIGVLKLMIGIDHRQHIRQHQVAHGIVQADHGVVDHFERDPPSGLLEQCASLSRLQPQNGRDALLIERRDQR